MWSQEEILTDVHRNPALSAKKSSDKKKREELLIKGGTGIQHILLVCKMIRNRLPNARVTLAPSPISSSRPYLPGVAHERVAFCLWAKETMDQEATNQIRHVLLTFPSSKNLQPNNRHDNLHHHWPFVPSVPSPALLGRRLPLPLHRR